MPNYGTLTAEIIKDRLRQEEERFKDRKRALEARINAMRARTKSVGELKKWMERRGLTVSDLMWMGQQLRPKRADKPVKSKRPLHPDVKAAREQLNGHKRSTSRTPAKGKLGIALRKWREDNGVSTLEAAKKIGTHFTSLNAWERGAQMPGKESIRANILKATGLPEDIFN